MECKACMQPRLLGTSIDTLKGLLRCMLSAHEDHVTTVPVMCFIMEEHTLEQQDFMLTFRTAATYSIVLKVNVVGVFLTTKAFVPLLRKKQSRTIVQLSSIFASTSFNRKGTENNPAATKLIAYNSSKAAVNMRKLTSLGI